ncbi:WD40 repeat domain-containing protein [Fulvitalea axinellae]|uniref:WD40 repeat domain-containing protein n=1 Tax=Fulvitalea axinellae TaxID=1182444 RepID=UPI0030CA3E7E
MTGHKDAVYTLEKAWAPELFFSAGADGMVVLWNLKEPGKGRMVAKVQSSVYAIMFDAESSRLYVGQNHEGIHVIDPVKREKVGDVALGNVAIFDIVSIGSQILVACSDGVIRVVDCESLSVVKTLPAAGQSCRSLAVRPNAKEFVAGYSDNAVRLFGTEPLFWKKEIPAHAKSVFALRYSPDGKRLFTVSRDAKIKVWDAENDYANIQTVDAHMYAINHLAQSPNGLLLATCSMDKSIKLWDAESLRLLKVIDKARHAGHGTSVNRLLWAGYDNLLISASDDRSVSVWELKRNTPEP